MIEESAGETTVDIQPIEISSFLPGRYAMVMEVRSDGREAPDDVVTLEFVVEASVYTQVDVALLSGAGQEILEGDVATWEFEIANHGIDDDIIGLRAEAGAFFDSDGNEITSITLNPQQSERVFFRCVGQYTDGGAELIDLTFISQHDSTEVSYPKISLVVTPPLSDSGLDIASGIGDLVDPELEAAIRRALGNLIGDINEADLLGLTSLSVSFRGISSIEGIQHCVNLTELYLGSNQIVDITPPCEFDQSYAALSGSQ